jgi:hypothetical protein
VGGFAVTVQYGLPRSTADVDVLSIEPSDQVEAILSIGGERRRLHNKHGVYIQVMGSLVTLPEDSLERAVKLFRGRYERLRLFGLDPYDLALSKLERNAQRDRDDVKYLFKTVPLDLDILKRRYRTEQRPYLADEAKHDLTSACGWTC